MLGLERVGVDESFFELGGDSISSMQVVARARAAGLVCRPRDIFIEQTVAGLARVAGVADGAGGPSDEGIGAVVATPIMCWLASVEGPVDQFNQTVLVQAPAGVSQADVVVCCRPWWIGMPCCGRALMMMAPGAGRYGCPRPARWRRAGACTQWTCYPMRR